MVNKFRFFFVVVEQELHEFALKALDTWKLAFQQQNSDTSSKCKQTIQDGGQDVTSSVFECAFDVRETGSALRKLVSIFRLSCMVCIQFLYPGNVFNQDYGV